MEGIIKISPHRLPRQCMDVTVAQALEDVRDHRVGRYPGWWNNLHRLPKRMFKRSVAVMGAEHKGSSTYRCGGSAG